MFQEGFMEREVLDIATSHAWIEEYLEKKYSSKKKLPRKKESDFSEKSSRVVENYLELMKHGALYRLKVTALKAADKEYGNQFNFPPSSEDHPALLLDIGDYQIASWFWGTTKRSTAFSKLNFSRKLLPIHYGGVVMVPVGKAAYFCPITKKNMISPIENTFFTIHPVAKHYSRIKEPFTGDLYRGLLDKDLLDVAVYFYTRREVDEQC